MLSFKISPRYPFLRCICGKQYSTIAKPRVPPPSLYPYLLLLNPHLPFPSRSTLPDSLQVFLQHYFVLLVPTTGLPIASSKIYCVRPDYKAVPFVLKVLKYFVDESKESAQRVGRLNASDKEYKRQEGTW